MRGRKPLNSKLKEASGAFQHDPQRRNSNEPEPPPGAPDKPDYLDKIASAKWDHVIRLFEQMGMLNQADGDLLETYCVTYSGYRQALASVNKTGQVLTRRDRDGNQVLTRNPFSVELHKYLDRMSKLLAEMGLTPSSRSRVMTTGSKEADPLLELMKRRATSN